MFDIIRSEHLGVSLNKKKQINEINNIRLIIEVGLHKRINKSKGKFSAFTFEGVCVNRDAAPLFLDFNIRWSESHTCHFIFREK